MNIELREFLIEAHVILHHITSEMSSDKISEAINGNSIHMLNMLKFTIAKFYSENCEASDAAVLDKKGSPNNFLVKKALNLSKKHMDEFVENLKNIEPDSGYSISLKDGIAIQWSDKKSSK